MTSKLSVRAAWEQYLRMVIPAGAPAIQREECKRAFYAGAISVFYGIVTCLEPGAEPTAADLALMDELHAELEAYAAELERGAPVKPSAHEVAARIAREGLPDDGDDQDPVA